MKYGKIPVVLAVLAVIMVMVGCATAPVEIEETPPLIPGPNESVVVIQRKKAMAGAAISMTVWIDGAEAASSIRSGQEVKLLVANGGHSIQAGSSALDRGNEVSFSVTGEEIIFFAEPKMGVIAARFQLTQTGKRNL
jgi:hypothetical protein